MRKCPSGVFDIEDAGNGEVILFSLSFLSGQLSVLNSFHYFS